MAGLNLAWRGRAGLWGPLHCTFKRLTESVRVHPGPLEISQSEQIKSKCPHSLTPRRFQDGTSLALRSEDRGDQGNAELETSRRLQRELCLMDAHTQTRTTARTRMCVVTTSAVSCDQLGPEVVRSFSQVKVTIQTKYQLVEINVFLGCIWGKELSGFGVNGTVRIGATVASSLTHRQETAVTLLIELSAAKRIKAFPSLSNYLAGRQIKGKVTPYSRNVMKPIDFHSNDRSAMADVSAGWHVFLY